MSGGRSAHPASGQRFQLLYRDTQIIVTQEADKVDRGGLGLGTNTRYGACRLSEQITEFKTQSHADIEHGLDAWQALSPFDVRDGFLGLADALGKLFLRQPLGGAGDFQTCPYGALQVIAHSRSLISANELDHRSNFGNQSDTDVIFRYQPDLNGPAIILLRRGRMSILSLIRRHALLACLASVLLGGGISGGVTYLIVTPNVPVSTTVPTLPPSPAMAPQSNAPATPTQFHVLIDALEPQPCDLTTTAAWTCRVVGVWAKSGGFKWDNQRIFSLGFHPNDHSRFMITDENGRALSGYTWDNLVQGVVIGQNHRLRVSL